MREFEARTAHAEAKTLVVVPNAFAVRPATGRVVQVRLVVEVDRHDLGCTAPFHLEGPEPVQGADVKTAHSVESGRKPVVVLLVSEVKDTVSDHAGREFHDVIPVDRRGPFGKFSSTQHGAAPYLCCAVGIVAAA